MSDVLERLGYWRKRYAQELRTRRQYGMATFDGCSEYEFMKRHPFRPVLAQLRMVEAAIRCDVMCREAVQAWREVA